MPRVSSRAVAYSFQDPLSNLRIRVRLYRVASIIGASFQPVSPFLAHSSVDVEGERDDTYRPQSETEEYTFKWQEKLFSEAEFELYADSSACDTVLKKQYHTEIAKIKSQQVQRPNRRIFSYVEGDNLEGVPQQERMKNQFDDTSSDKLLHLRHRRISPQSPALRNPVADLPSAAAMKRAHRLPQASKVMYIMVELAPAAESAAAGSSQDIHILCQLKVLNDKVLLVSPDFNDSSSPYRVESRAGVFHYTVENASGKEFGRELMGPTPEAISFKQHMLPTKVGGEFELPEDGILQLSVLGEIVAAKNFEYNNLFVHYMVDLPKGWSSQSSNQLTGITPCCRTAEVDGEEVAHFSFPLDFNLQFNIAHYEVDLDSIAKWPQLLIEVLSLDSWNIFRLEGYGYITLPAFAGKLTETVKTWRPAETSGSSQLQRYFVGGVHELEDLSYSRLPAGHSVINEPKLSKFGFRTVSSGSVVLNFYTILQCREFITKDDLRLQYGSVLQRMGGGLHSSIISVLEAFQKARQRMITVRDNVLTTKGFFVP